MLASMLGSDNEGMKYLYFFFLKEVMNYFFFVVALILFLIDVHYVVHIFV